MSEPVCIELPYPPTINTYWRRVGSKTLISKAGREFRQRVISLIAYEPFKKFTGPIAVSIVAYPPDRRRRDLDNLFKSLLDAMEHAGVYEDDSQIARLAIERGEVIPEVSLASLWSNAK